MDTNEKAAPAGTGTASDTASHKANHIPPLVSGQCSPLPNAGTPEWPQPDFLRQGGDE